MSDDPAPEEVYREFIREMTLRIERSLRALAQEIREESRIHRDNGGPAPAT